MALPRTRGMLTWLISCLLLTVVNSDPVADWQLPALMEFQKVNSLFFRDLFATWKVGRDCSEWWNIVCIAGRVTEMNFGSSKGREIILTPGLGTLTSLNKMDFSSNEIKGPIPRSYGNLVNLVTLYVRIGKAV